MEPVDNARCDANEIDYNIVQINLSCDPFDLDVGVILGTAQHL